jgi:hypothetical protein
MAIQYRIILLGLVLLALVGCRSRAFGNDGLVIEPVTENEVVRSIRYFDEEDTGPEYTISVSLPDSWVGQVETRNEGNSIAFEYLTENRGRVPVFYIEALSNDQYWEQIGSYPGSYTNIGVTYDTYFITYSPSDSYFSGLSDEDFTALTDEVPLIIATFRAERVEQIR